MKNVAYTAFRLLVPLVAAIQPMASHATTYTYAGSGSTGVDPLSSTWTAGPNPFGFPTFVEPLQNNEFPTFKGGEGLTYATSLVFTYTGSDPQEFNDLLGSGLTHVATPNGAQWDTTYLSPNLGRVFGGRRRSARYRRYVQPAGCLH